VTERKKVAIVTPGSFPIPGVKSSSVERVVLKMAELLQDEVDVFIFGKKTIEQPFYEKRGSITFHRNYIPANTYIQQTIKQLELLQPDIIQVENRPRFAKEVRLAMPKAKIILVMQSTRFMSLPHIGKKEWAACIDMTDHIVVNSHYLKEYIINETNCPSNKITVNHLGVDLTQFKPKWNKECKASIKQLKREWGVKDKKILLYVGRLVEIKGIHYILEAMPEIIEADPSIVLFIAGITLSSTSENKEYEERLHRLAENMKGHVFFTPFVQNEMIQHWYQMADLLVVPSIAEPFGLVNIEAMATGTPVIATNSGGIPEIIEHGKTGILINPNQMREELISHIPQHFSNPQKIKEMRVECVSHVRNHFTWQHTVKRQLALYSRLTDDVIEER
jgi:spore coat protein SA